jgi:hypothetical protein
MFRATPEAVAVKRKLPAMPCVRCGKPSTGRRAGWPTCLRCWVELTERKADKDLRKAGRKLWACSGAGNADEATAFLGYLQGHQVACNLDFS